MRNSYLFTLNRVLFAAVFVVTLGTVQAQVALTRTYFTGAYTSIFGQPGTNWATTAQGDDNVATAIPIGFTFNYLGTNFTTVDANTNGAMGFGASGVVGTTRDNTILYTTTAPQGVVSAWFDDMTIDTSSTVGGRLLYQTSGTVGSQVFTLEWRNTSSYFTGATQRLNYQIKLYEGTNVIEFRYGTMVAGTASTSESASIGCKNATGGPGNFLDVVTGSNNLGNYFVNAATGWPTRHYRLAPGTPTAIAAGTYTAGSTGTYPNLSEAVADLNHRGVAGPVVISLTDANYDISTNGENWFPIGFGPIAGTSLTNTVTVQPASGTSTLTYNGYVTGGMATAGGTGLVGTTSEPVVVVSGTDYLLLNNLNLTSGGNANLDRGLLVINNSTTNGATFCGFQNIAVTLNRSNTSTIGIQQNVASTPASALGANSNNAYMNLNIQNTYNGIYLLGNATFPDLNCQIGNTVAANFNTIGGSTANDIGTATATTQNYGIRMGNQSGGSIYNNNVQNVGSSTTTDGILVELSQGTTSVYRNNVSFVRGNSATATTNVCGIRANVATTTGHNLRVYNNGVSNILSSYTGAATATKAIKGIFVQSAGGGVTGSSINVDNNSVYLDLGTNLNMSSVCYEIGTASGPVINCRNNIFVNATGAQTAPAGHWGMRSTSATLTGNTGSASDRNDVYMANTTQGFFGQGNATDYATLANWQAAMVGQDAASVSADPGYTSPTIGNLHASTAAPNNAASVVAWVTNDIDNQTRSVTTPDIGYDEYTPATLDVGATALITPAAGACYSATEPVTVRILNYAVGTHNFSTNPVTVTVNVTGAVTATINTTVNTGTLAAGATQNVLVGNVNMSAAGTYTFNAATSMTGDQNSLNDAMLATNRTFAAGTATATPPTVCAGDSATLTIAGQNGSTILWQMSTNGGLTWTNTSGTTSPYKVLPTDTTMYRAQVCGLIFSTPDTVVWIDTTPPTTQGDTVCGLDSATIAAFGVGPFQFYDSLTGGSVVHSGSPWTTMVPATTTYYAASASGAQTATHLTTMAAGNGSAGNVFAIRTLSTITITGFNVHCSSTAGTLTNWEVWYRPNDYLLTPGSQNSNVGWTQLGVYTGIPSAGPGIETVLPNNINLQMPANSKWSFMVAATSGSVSYTNGTTTGNLYNANADLEVYQGHGGTYFNLPNNPRVFNGRIKYSKGCPSTRTPVTITVNPAPAITVSASDSVSCSGDPVDLYVSSGNSGYGYTWTPGATLSSTTGDTTTASPGVTTTYQVVALDTATGCRNIGTTTITWIAKPVVTAMVAPDTICAMDSITLTSTVSPIIFQLGNGTVQNTSSGYPSPYGNWYWGSRHQMLIRASELQGMGLGAGWINSMAFDVVNLNGTQPLDNFEIKMALTNVNSITTWQTPSFTSVFTSLSYAPALGVNPMNFTSNFYWDGNSNILIEVCHNNSSYIANVSVNQTATSFSSTVWYNQDATGVCANPAVNGSIAQRPNMYFSMVGVYGYEWTPSANLATPNAASTVGIATQTTDFILSVLDSTSGCVGVDTATVFAYPLPAINLGNDGYFCGSSATLDAGNPGSTYIWSTMDSSQTIFVNQNGTYSVDVTDSFGCHSADTVAITFTPFPVVSLGPNQTACQGTNVTLNAGLTPGSYLWAPTGDTTQTIVVTTSGSYSVEYTDTFGCSGADTVNVTINPLPSVTATAATDTICNTNNDLVLLTGSPTGGTFTGTGVTGNQFSAPTAGPGSHNITYSFTDGNGCSNTATVSIFVETCVGIADGMNSFMVGVRPNPNNGQFMFSVSVDNATEVSYEIADARGVIVLRDKSLQGNGMFEQAIDLKDFSAGVYTLRVSMDGKTAYKRIVVQR
ncbi:MAG: T9SS type A sorting domain-containing protein [Bacteroidia bacterium]